MFKLKYDEKYFQFEDKIYTLKDVSEPVAGIFKVRYFNKQDFPHSNGARIIDLKEVTIINLNNFRNRYLLTEKEVEEKYPEYLLF